MVSENYNYGLDYNKIYYSDNYGAYIILETYKSINRKSPTALIRFLSTGYERVVNIDKAKSGEVSDKSANIKIPIDTNLLSEEEKYSRLDRMAKEIWRCMIRRCYDTNVDNFISYGSIGIKVCDRWLLRDNFLADLPFVPQYDKWCRFPTVYQLDKDYLQLNVPKNERIYSLETCMFLHANDNKNLRTIELRNNNTTLSAYYGVTIETAKTYGVQMNIGNAPVYFGTFSDEIVAASVFNYWQEYFHRYELIPLINNVPYMSPDEFIKYNTNPKTMCVITNNKERLNL